MYLNKIRFRKIKSFYLKASVHKHQLKTSVHKPHGWFSFFFLQYHSSITYFLKKEKFSSIKEIFYWTYSVLYFFDSSNVFSQ